MKFKHTEAVAQADLLRSSDGAAVRQQPATGLTKAVSALYCSLFRSRSYLKPKSLRGLALSLPRSPPPSVSFSLFLSLLLSLSLFLSLSLSLSVSLSLSLSAGGACAARMGCRHEVGKATRNRERDLSHFDTPVSRGGQCETAQRSLSLPPSRSLSPVCPPPTFFPPPCASPLS